MGTRGKGAGKLGKLGKLGEMEGIGELRAGPSSGEQRCPGVLGVASALVWCESKARLFLTQG